MTLVSSLTVQEVLQEVTLGGMEQEEGDGDDEQKAKSDYVSGIRRRWSGKGERYLLGDPGLLMAAVYGAGAAQGAELERYCHT